MDEKSKKALNNLLGKNDEKLIAAQRNTMEAEADAAVAMKLDNTKTLAEKLPEEMQVELKNLAFMARAIGELSSNNQNSKAIQSLIINGLSKQAHPADILSSIVEYFSYQDKRVIKAMELLREGSVIKPIPVISFLDFMAEYVPKHPMTDANRAIAADLKSEIIDSSEAKKLVDVEGILNSSSNSATKSKDYTNPDVQVDELMKRVVPGSKAMN
jgi:hypothetical protein